MSRTKSRYLVAILFAVSSCAAFAESSNPFIGKWKVTWQGKQPWEAKLVIDQSGGSWQTFARSKTNSCTGLEVPIAVESSSENEMTIKLKFSILQGCTDSTVHLKRVGGDTISGTRGMVSLVLSRQ